MSYSPSLDLLDVPVCPKCEEPGPDSRIRYCGPHLRDAIAEYQAARESYPSYCPICQPYYDGDALARECVAHRQMPVPKVSGVWLFLAALAFTVSGCATEPPHYPPVYVQCPGDKLPHYMSVEQFRLHPDCWMV